jgi:hypothetical protein
MRELPAPVRAREAREGTGVSIEVPAGERRLVGPFGDYDDVFRIVEVSRFEDLQELRLIPEGISEQDAIDAVLADEKVWQQERLRHTMDAGGCDCSESDRISDSTPVRRSRQFTNLVELLEAAYQRPMSVDDPGVMLARHHLTRWIQRPPIYLVGWAAADVIHVAQNGLLVMSSTVHAVNASTITLEDDARLRFESGYVNVRCDTLNGPELFSLFPGIVDLLLGLDLGPSHAENPVDPNDLPQDMNAYKYLPGYSREHLFVSAD